MSTENKTGKVGMLIFLAAETMFFAGLIAAYWILRGRASPWPPLGQPRLPVLATGVNTIILLCSAYTMGRAEKSLFWLKMTWVGGALFLLLQGREWVRLIGFGMKGAGNIYAGIFYLVIGVHAAHVLAALIFLFFVILKIRKETGEAVQNRLEVARIYWFFVVGIWPLLYVLVYLI